MAKFSHIRICMCFVCLHNRVHDPHLAGGSTLWPHTHTERISPHRSAHKCHNLFMPLCVHLCCPHQWNLLWCSASCGRRAFCSCFSYWALVHTRVTPTYSPPSQLMSHCIVLAYLKLNCLLNGIMRTLAPCPVILTRSLGILDVSRARSNQFSPTSVFGADFDYFVEFYLLLSHHPLWGSDQLSCHLILIVRDCGPHVKSTLGKLRWYLNALLRLVGKKRNSNEIVQRFIEDFNIL